VPSSTYPCADGKYIIIGGNGDSIFKRLMRVVGRADLAEDARVARNDGRVQHEAEIDDAIEAWTRERPFAEVLRALEDADVPAGPIYSVADQVADPHFQARGLFEDVTVSTGKTVTLPALAPRLADTPGGTSWPGPPLGAHNDEVYREVLGLGAADLAALRANGTI
jgi:crotonobetainyl-CoA:carnitine CoA-transferase CaiB-like acyl-CoA transferase